MDHELPPIETPREQRVADFKRHRLPVIVWSVAALACLVMLAQRAARFEYIGLARSAQYEISASEVGRIETLLVELYDRVEAGELVAKLDDVEAAARVARSQATIRQLGAELEAARAQVAKDLRLDRAGWRSDLRRFETDEEDRRLAALELRAAIAGDEIEEERLAVERERSGPLFEAGLIGQSAHDDIRLQHAAVRKRVEENRLLLAQTESELRNAKLRREEFQRGLPSIPAEESLLRPLREALEVESHRLQEIQARRDATALRSPVTGRVSGILCRQGQTVVPGEPILTITEEQVGEILAYVDETEGGRARERSPVIVASLSRPGTVAESFVVRVGPDVEMLPQRLWREPTTPEYGRALVIAPVPGLHLTPGELLSVKLAD